MTGSPREGEAITHFIYSPFGDLGLGMGQNLVLLNSKGTLDPKLKFSPYSLLF